MKTIKAGNLKKLNPEFNFECPHCDCEFTATQSELYTRTDEGQGRSWDVAICPTCKRSVGKSYKGKI